MSLRVHVIACGVLAVDLKRIAAEADVALTLQFLPGGLHRTPRELKVRLQEAIDAVSESGTADRIAIGYGVCGLGTAGLRARAVPLAIPRVHDCIALFLGSDAEYRRQFAAFPGTYYIAEGWVEEKSRPLSNDRKADGAVPGGATEDDLVSKYGAENADAIRHFLSSWQRNYQRAAFINTGGEGDKSRYARIARDMAAEFGWVYSELPGTRDLLLALLKAEESSPEVLVVPPRHITLYDALGRTLTSAPETVPAAPPAGAPAPAAPADSGAPDGIGLGIDAGGTYTDVALFDFAAREVRQKAKALTTRWDYLVGIEAALAQLDAAALARVNLVSISTTLATNAIVEGRGQPVGLLLMPPYGRFDGTNFKHAPIVLLEGKLEIDGKELAPVNPEQVRRAALELIERHRVGAFAVAGYASHVNPAHELQVKAAVREVCGLTVTCGHDISEGANYRVRAETAALNARIIPYLEALLDRTREAMRRRGIEAPIMVVRSDGSLMGLDAARERPIETILSGPAASVAGARFLAGTENAVVVDVGGTTTDTAIIRAGVARTCEDGATVGGWKTHVRALDMRTLGLGGDSLVAVRSGELSLGPRRVAPLSWLQRFDARADRALNWAERHADRFAASTEGLEWLALVSTDDVADVDEGERRLLDALRDGPACLDELAERLGLMTWKFLPLRHLEERHLVQRCGFTPTDVLHAQGELGLWDRGAAERGAALFAGILGTEPAALCRDIRALFVRLLALELMKKQIDESHPADGIDHSPVARALVDQALGVGDLGLDVHIRLRHPVVGIGAPVHFFLPDAAARLGTRAVIPPHADVANAVGAITSRVVVHRRFRIAVNEKGQYTVEGLAGAPLFESFDAAEATARRELQGLLRRLALHAGTSSADVAISVSDHVTTLADGGQLFLGRTLEGYVSGVPGAAGAPPVAG